MDADDEQLLTSAEVAKRLRVSPRTIARWVKEGRISAAYVTPGGLYRFRWDDVRQELGLRKPNDP